MEGKQGKVISIGKEVHVSSVLENKRGEKNNWKLCPSCLTPLLSYFKQNLVM